MRTQESPNYNLRTAGFVLVVVALVVIIAWGFFSSRDGAPSDSPASSPEVTAPADQSNSAPTPTGSSSETAPADEVDTSLIEAIIAFEEAYYTLDPDIKALAYERLTSEDYRKENLDPQMRRLPPDYVEVDPRFKGVTAHAVGPVENQVISDNDEGDGSKYVSTQLIIEMRKDGAALNEAIKVPEVHHTYWQQIDGEWRVIANGID